MASVTSQGRSRCAQSPFSYESNGDSEESWQHSGYSSGGSNPGSVRLLPSPASGSLIGFTLVGHVSAPSPSVISPLPLTELGPSNSWPFDSSGVPEARGPSTSSSENFATAASDGPGNNTGIGPDQFLLSQQQPFQDFLPQFWNDALPFTNTLQTDAFTTLGHLDSVLGSEGLTLDSAQLLNSDPNIPSWSPAGITENNFVFEDSYLPSSSWSTCSSVSLTSSPSPSESSPSKTNTGTPSRKVKSGKVEKKKPAKKRNETADNFVIVTPSTIMAHAGRPNMYECFESMNCSQRGRKGPLADATKKSALQVRRRGACFCCHSRKVKCDETRPCQNCNRLCKQLPQIICWRFQDFLPTLFPDFLRTHFQEAEMTEFVQTSVRAFTVRGVQMPCEVELFSGPGFSSTLTVKATFFTPKSEDIQRHWHLTASRYQKVDLQMNNSVPIGVDLEETSSRNHLRTRTKAYVQNITREPNYAEQVTDSLRSTFLPKNVLRIVQTYARHSDSTVVRRALSIYTMQYILTRHLCLTSGSLFSLHTTGLVPQDQAHVTPRLLARQIKSLLDELMLREMQLLFDLFSRSLKPKARSEWAPCLAAFLVLTLFMESVETATDSFAIAENEINLRQGNGRTFERGSALKMCKEVENLPFKQFVYQFHNLYQTHPKDANTRGFNPLLDKTIVENGELDGAATQMVQSLQELYYGEDWREMDFLATDDMILGGEEHPFPMDPAILYTGRLLAKFLVSFRDESVIFDSRI